MIHKNLLYKYMGFDGDQPRTSFLENESFRFTQRSLLNDPFETLPIIYPPNQYAEEDWDVAREEAVRAGNSNISQEDLKRLYLDTLLQRYDEKRFPMLYPRRIPEFDNAFVRSSEGYDKAKSNKVYSEIMKELDKYGIFCLTETRESLVMLTHYAKDHKGLVVGFNREHSFFLQNSPYAVEYSNRIIPITINNGLVRVNGRVNSVALHLLFRKHTDWSYEKEWRLIKNLEDCNRLENNKDVYFLKIPNTSINNITLGANMPQNEIESICNKISTDNRWSHLTVYKAELSPKEYSLDFKQLLPIQA
jgi:hypothetical protein